MIKTIIILFFALSACAPKMPNNPGKPGDPGYFILSSLYCVIVRDCLLPQQGELDKTFGTGNGYVTFDYQGKDDEGDNVVTDNDGKILVAGVVRASPSNERAIVIWRYNSDGTLDTTFNNQGFVVAGSNYIYKGITAGTNPTVSDGIAGTKPRPGIALDADGKIIVAGVIVNPAQNYDMALWRFNSDGTLDTTFNGTGLATFGNAAGGNNDDLGVSVDLAKDGSGSIFVGGSSWSTAGYRMIVWKVKKDGTLDTSFGGSGYVQMADITGYSTPMLMVGLGIVAEKSGKVVLNGYVFDSLQASSMLVYKLNSDGSADTTFNGIGYIDSKITGVLSWSVNEDADGKILVSGVNHDLPFTFLTMSLIRYNNNGSLDPTFNGNGKLFYDAKGLGYTGSGGTKAIYDSAGNILLSGGFLTSPISFLSSGGSSLLQLAVWRFKPDGTLSNFGNKTGNVDGSGNVIKTGYYTFTSKPNDSSFGLGVALDNTGRIIVTGSDNSPPPAGSTGFTSDMLLLRLQ